MNELHFSASRETRSFPSIRIPSANGDAAIEVHLIAQLGIGAGSPLVRSIAARQSQHPAFLDEKDEPSARIGAMHPERGDHSSLYSFVVESKGHPFHAHAGRRMFTAISGSGGTQLRFSSLPEAAFESDPDRFVESLHLVDIPPDCLFTVRFDSGIWHQFASNAPGSNHPALVAMSCHPDERFGLEDSTLLEQVEANEASIPMLTRELPFDAQRAAKAALERGTGLKRTQLYLQGHSHRWRNRLCAAVRKPLGAARMVLSRLTNPLGTEQSQLPDIPVHSASTVPGDSLLNILFKDHKADHEDAFHCDIALEQLPASSAHALMDRLLTSFKEQPPWTVTALMTLRNVLVRPFRLRRSRLGCPVSSLADQSNRQRFANRHPVLAQRCSEDARAIEVMLGADDRHLRFRTSIGVRFIDPDTVRFSISSRVCCRNLWGRAYMRIIHRTHVGYVSPKLIRDAARRLVMEALLKEPGLHTRTLAP